MKRIPGFTLVEIMVVVVIVGILLALATPGLLSQLRRAHAVENLANVRSAAALVQSYYANPRYNGVLPLTTPSTAVPYNGSNPSVTVFATLDHVFLATGLLAKPMHWSTQSPVLPIAATGIAYDPAAAAFVDSGTLDVSAFGAGVAGFRSRVSTPTVTPSAAAGGNFRLNFTDDLPANAIVVFAVLSGIPDHDALALAEQLLPSDRVPALGAACDIGPIAYAASSGGVTTVYLYVTHR